MKFADKLRKQSNWTITAMTAGAITVVAATGFALADDGGSRNSLDDRINLQDRTPVSQMFFEPATDGPTVIAPSIFEGSNATNSFDSPLDAGTIQADAVDSVNSVASVMSPDSVQSVASVASVMSPDSVQSVASVASVASPDSAQSVASVASYDSTASFDSAS